MFRRGRGLVGPRIVAASTRPEDFRDRQSRHRHAIGGSLGFKLVPRAFPDDEIDQLLTLGIVDRFSQQLLVAIVVVARFLLTHGTPRAHASTYNILDQGPHARNGFAGITPMRGVLISFVLQN